MKLIYNYLHKKTFNIFLVILLAIVFQSIVSAKSNIETKIKILNGLFSNCQLKSFDGKQAIVTTARNQAAVIPLNDEEFKLLTFDKGVCIAVFNIYLSDNEDDYGNMKKAELYNFMDLTPGDKLEHLKKNERLIQVIAYDLNKNKFIAKANTFPIEKLDWLPTGMGDLTQYESVSNFVKINPTGISCYLQMSECPDCSNVYYFMKLIGNELKCSSKHAGCFENIRELQTKITADQITNCYEAEYNGEQPEKQQVELLSW